jgi:hypothetical protein
MFSIPVIAKEQFDRMFATGKKRVDSLRRNLKEWGGGGARLFSREKDQQIL